MSGSPALEWGRVMTPLARKFRVIAPCQIGFGPSDQPDLPYDSATFVDYLGGFLHARAAEDAVILGESFGGWVVSQYALRQGTKTAWGLPLPRISRLVITDGAVQLPPGSGSGPEKPSINDPEVGKLAHDIYLTYPPADDSKVKMAVGPNILAQQATDDQLKSLKIPTLLIWGREDQLIPLDVGRHVAAQIPNSKLVIIDGCGHIPSVEQPRAFLGALGGFLGVGLETL
jgi:triacylglycerol lipase